MGNMQKLPRIVPELEFERHYTTKKNYSLMLFFNRSLDLCVNTKVAIYQVYTFISKFYIQK